LFNTLHNARSTQDSEEENDEMKQSGRMGRICW
jgi:hypothetical protein